jgi:CheY-like chemotaxis protein
MAPPRAARKASVSPQIVLLVDSDEDTRHLYATWLASRGYGVAQAGDGREALAMALTRRPDLIVTELRLTGIDGIDLCELLKRDPDTRTIPIVVVTGEDRVPAARCAGVDEILVKPCRPDVLLAAIVRLGQAMWSSMTAAEAPAAAHAPVTHRIGRSAEPLRASLPRSRSHQRYETTTPAVASPHLVCPSCLQPLQYERSFIGGVNPKQSEQWDYLRCPGGCGIFQYRHRTRKLSKVMDEIGPAPR